MTSLRKPGLVALMLAGLLALAVPALAAQYDIDVAHSTVGFKVKHMAVSWVKGTFDDFGGTFSFDPAAPAGAKVEAEIKMASISTGNAKRDGHLLSPDFFDAEKFPTMTFASTGLEMTSATEGVLKGNLTMHGVTREVALALTYNGGVKDPWGTERVGFSATGTLNRQDYGLTYNTVLETGGLAVGNDIYLTIEIEGTLKK